MYTPLPVSIAVATYRREAVLIDTLQSLLGLDPPAGEILVIDQTEKHEPGTEEYLRTQAASARIRWLKLLEPSIPKSMNVALFEASQPIVLFVDDDIRPASGLVTAHVAAHEAHGDVLVAGKVIQPWDEGRDYSGDTHFHFAADRSHWIREFIGCNFSVQRTSALELGGFDENFVRVAYRFEAEFAHRFLASGRRIFYEPAACLHHLKAGSGGTRTFGEHLTTWRPDHAVGAYYFGLRTGSVKEFLIRPVRAIATRYHLRHPWRIPATLWAEVSGMLWALALFLRGPKRLPPVTKTHHA